MLTHISLASFLWDIRKQNSPSRCDTERRVVPFDAILLAYMHFIEKRNITSDVTKNKSGLTHLMRTGKSVRHIWVNAMSYQSDGDIYFLNAKSTMYMYTRLKRNAPRKTNQP